MYSIAELIEAANSASVAGHITGTTKWAAHMQKVLSFKELTPCTAGDPLYRAAINCPHEIDRESVILKFDPNKPGLNALNQLGRRLHAAQLAAIEQLKQDDMTPEKDPTEVSYQQPLFAEQIIHSDGSSGPAHRP